MVNEFGYGHWLGEEDCLSCQGGLFWASSPTEFSANGGIAQGGISPWINLRQLTPDGRFGCFNIHFERI